jgi:hypothetical protein
MKGHDSGGIDRLLLSELNLDRHLVSGLTQGDYKRIRRDRPHGAARTQLFNLAQDPAETRDLHAQAAEIVEVMESELDRWEAEFAGGIYVEFINGSALSDSHRLEGTLEVLGGGIFSSWSLTDVEEVDRVEMNASRTQIRFAVELANQPNPIEQPPPVFVDKDRIRFDLSDPEAQFQLDLNIDGRPARPTEFLLGRGSVASSRTVPLLTSLADADIKITSLGLAQGGAYGSAQVHCRVYAVAGHESVEVEIDPELDKRLRALGYAGD